VFLKIYTTNGWQTLVRATSNINGCGSFTMGSYTNYYAKVVAQNNVTGYGGRVLYSWYGETPLWANPGWQSPFLGTGVVYCTPIAAYRC
jgi:hypothetical protein